MRLTDPTLLDAFRQPAAIGWARGDPAGRCPRTPDGACRRRGGEQNLLWWHERGL